MKCGLMCFAQTGNAYRNDLLTGGWPDYSNIGQTCFEYVTV